MTWFLAYVFVALAIAGFVNLFLYHRWKSRPRDMYEGRPEAFSEGFYYEPARPQARRGAGLVQLSLAAFVLAGLIARMLDVW
ncbi:hypothetical protein ACIBTV_30865 [Micromonospora sp. NPDC049366]|uniref:hypothetical protein n=1 Tax=Micromonospora sp. NPDC049366 TaxID=3364271 RepID=UPI0037AD733B